MSATHPPLPVPGFLTRFANVSSWRGNLPHWEHPGTAVFITFRIGDALPMDKLAPWQEEMEEWRLAHPQPWNYETSKAFARQFRTDIERWLDAGWGSCPLAKPKNRQCVENALHFYDGKRLTLYASVVMPNHVHLLFMPHEGETVREIIRDLKHFTSRALTAQKTWDGEFWQREYWDTLIRDEAHFKRVINYIKGNNPEIAFDAYAAREEA